MTELKPCPFCGNMPKIHDVKATTIELWMVECNHCGALMTSSTLERVTENWNRRGGEN